MVIIEQSGKLEEKQGKEVNSAEEHYYSGIPMVIGGNLCGMMMNNQEPGVREESSEEMVGRLRQSSKDWVLPAVAVTTTESVDKMEYNGEAEAKIATTLASMSASSTRSPRQFRELIEMLLFCYLEYGGTESTEQFRNLVESFLHPVFEPVIFDPVKVTRSDTAVPVVVDMSKIGGITSVATPKLFSLTRADMPKECGSSSQSGISAGTSALTTPSSTVVVTPGSSIATKNMGQNGDEDVNGSMLCPVCFGVLIEPVTIMCGHSYCKKCLQREVSGSTCRRCRYYVKPRDVGQCKTNVLLGGLVEKWWPNQITATRLRNEGNDLYRDKQVDKAIGKYDQALTLVPDDHLSLANRSNCLLTVGKSDEALEDADAAIKYCPQWPKGHFRRSCAMINLGRYEEAFLSLTVCMYLMKLSTPKRSLIPVTGAPSSAPSTEDPGRALVINKMIKILQKLFLQTTSVAVGSTLKRHSLSTAHANIQYTPYPGARRRASAADAYNRQGWQDSEYNSSGDECDDVIQSHHHQKSWMPSRSSHRQFREHHHQQSLPTTTTVVEQLSLRMNRLFSRATQDLKILESRLKGNQGVKALPQVKLPQAVSNNDLECSLCYRLLFQPVSTECGHTFCRSCLDRCMDHNPACPLCKNGLQGYLACREHAVTEFLEVAIKSFLPIEYQERYNQHMDELNSSANSTQDKNVNADIPIFVCTMAFPTVPCPLHVFEPRYRLMIRRSMENGTNRFGMCSFVDGQSLQYGEIGTLLEIRNIQYFADGRSVVDTIGCRRFKVLNKSMVDGYNTASIEYLQDKPIQEDEVTVVKELHDKVFQEATQWLQSIGQVRNQRIHNHFGEMPAPEADWITSQDGPSWTWWLLAILPLDSKAQLSILSMCSLQKRLECIMKVLNLVKNRMGLTWE